MFITLRHLSDMRGAGVGLLSLLSLIICRCTALEGAHVRSKRAAAEKDNLLKKLSEKIDKDHSSILDYDTTDCLPNAIAKFRIFVSRTSEELKSYAEIYGMASSQVASLLTKFRHFHLAKSLYKEGSQNNRGFRSL
eukprot:TRINITY_DN13007_c0_g1_i1.p1 TRINITY_DN13007_c0_g1~~TRINITY_DN13007_c0_g1_i1.p1  ORF type:complete len:136 (-),score=29.58 TRINITY_DN13007_c0_g1_i1:65-472(-)